MMCLMGLTSLTNLMSLTAYCEKTAHMHPFVKTSHFFTDRHEPFCEVDHRAFADHSFSLVEFSSPISEGVLFLFVSGN